MERHFWAYTDIIILTKFLILLILSYLKSSYPTRFAMFLKIIYSNRYFIFYGAEPRSALTQFSVLFLFSQVMAVSLFMWYLQTQNIIAIDVFPLIPNVQNLVLMVSFILFVKWILQMIFAYILGISDEVGKYVFEKQTYFCYASLILYVFSLFCIENFEFSKFVTLVFIAMFLLINIFGTLNAFFRRIKTGNVLYFLLYICTFELLPLVIGFTVV